MGQPDVFGGQPVVDPDAFVEAMEDRWVNVLGNASNPNLRATWRQMCEEFNATIARTLSGRTGKWRVLTPETGTGKTEGTILYCSMLPAGVGVLVVEEMIVEAERVAKAINAISQDGRAIAVHSDLDPMPQPDAIAKCQVVVVTHRAFLDSLDAHQLLADMNGGVADQGTKAQARKWSALTRWSEGDRALMVIDEAPQLIQQASLTVQDLKEVAAVVPVSVWSKFPEAWRVLALLIDRLEKAEEEARTAREQGQDVRHRIVWTMNRALALFPSDLPDAELCVAAREFFSETDQSAFRSELRAQQVRSQLQRRPDPDRPKEDRAGIADIVQRMSALLAAFIHQSTKQGDGGSAKEVFSTGRCIVSGETPPAVILDATGDRSPTYPLLADFVEVVPRVSTCRTYRNVTLHVARLNHLGKRKTISRADTRIPQLAAALRSELAALGERSSPEVLVVTHKGVIRTGDQHKEPRWIVDDAGQRWMVEDDQRWMVDHWNNFHGTNRYQHCSVIAFLSLPYRDRTTFELEYNAALGSQPDDWFSSKAARKVRRKMHVLTLASSLVQAINRVRCRRPINANGDCLSTHVYLLLPPGKQGDEILGAIEAQMPKIRVVSWFLLGMAGARKKEKGSRFRDALIRVIEQISGDGMTKLELQARIGCKAWWMSKLLAEVNDPSTALGRAASARGIVYLPGRPGRLMQRAA